MANTTGILQAITIATNVLTIVFLVIAAWLFGSVYFSINTKTDTGSRFCPLYLKDYNSSNNVLCITAIICEVLATSGLLVLIKASILKFLRKENK